MGFIKSIFLGLVSLLIILSIIASLFFASAYNSLEYNNLKSSTNQILLSSQNEIIDSLEEEIIEIKDFCKEHDFIETKNFIIPCQTIYLGKEESNNFLISQNVSYTLNESYYDYLNDYCSLQEEAELTIYPDSKIKISCSELLENQNFVEVVFEPVFEFIYSQKYTCGFFTCIKQSPLYIFSKQSYEFMKSKFYLMNFVILILSLIIIFFSDKKSNSLIYLGSLFLLGTFLFKFIKNSFLSFVQNSLEKISFLINLSNFSELTKIAFQQSLAVIRIYYLFGFILILSGIGIYFYQMFFGPKTWTKSDIKKMINKN